MLLQATRGARNPNLQVVITHASHVCRQHSSGLPLRMNGMHRTQLTTLENTIAYHNTLCFRPKILHTHCLRFLLGVKMDPRETENNAYAKFWDDKQRVLWYVMAFSEWSI